MGHELLACLWHAVWFTVLCLACCPAVEPDRTVVVWPEEQHAGEWWVPFAVGAQHGVARCGTVEEARCLYSVLAAVMVGGEP